MSTTKTPEHIVYDAAKEIAAAYSYEIHDEWGGPNIIPDIRPGVPFKIHFQSPPLVGGRGWYLLIRPDSDEQIRPDDWFARCWTIAVMKPDPIYPGDSGQVEEQGLTLIEALARAKTVWERQALEPLNKPDRRRRRH